MDISQVKIQDLQLIHKGKMSSIYRLDNAEEGRAVALKITNSLSPRSGEPERLANELNISRNFTIPGLRKALGSGKIEGRSAVILEWVEGQTLREICRRETDLEYLKKLTIARNVAGNLTELHKLNIIYKNLNSENILVGPDLKTTLIDFSLAGQGSPSSLPVLSGKNEGDFAYTAPEQTGRTDLPMDYRADLYSLGVVLYELFSGELPFSGKNAYELIYEHITRIPRELYLVDREHPRILSDLVMKLLNKNPGERYQTAYGIYSDLEDALKQYMDKGWIDSFELCRNDISGHLLTGENLYVREEKLEDLKKAYGRARSGNQQVLLLTGPAGTGKTLLVNEFKKIVQQNKGIFVSGSFDQYKKHVLFNGLNQALTALVGSLTRYESDRLQKLGDKLQEETPLMTESLTTLFPQLKPLFSRHLPPDYPVPFSEERLLSSVHRVLSFLARECRPLVLFLDDLQWADSTTVKLIEALIDDTDGAPLLFIGAMDNSADPGDDYNKSPDIFRKLTAHSSLITIELENLDRDTYISFLRDILLREDKEMISLAEDLYGKTGGNPQLTIDYIYSLYREGSLYFDFETRMWNWDVKGLDEKNALVDISSTTSHTLEHLSPSCRELLTTASCIGDRFSLDLLASLKKWDIPKIRSDLEEAEKAFLIAPVQPEGYTPGAPEDREDDSHIYSFTHAYIRRIANTLLSSREKRRIHFTLGQYYLEEYSRDELEAHLFEVADQLNEGFQYIKKPEKLRELAELNLKAGKKALSFGLHKAANRYLNMGVGLLPVSRWETAPDLCLDFYQQILEAEYLSQNYSRVLTIASELDFHTDAPEITRKTHRYRILAYSAQGDYKEAFQASLNALDSLGVLNREDIPLASLSRTITPVQMDMVSIIKATHTLSREIHLESLLEKFILIVMENAGADKGVLIIEEEGEMNILCRASRVTETEITRERTPYRTSEAVPLSVIDAVINSKEEVILGNALHNPTLSGDDYIANNQVLSILALPIIHQGNMMGVLYLENRLMANVFLKDHLQLLNVLVTQAAISIQLAQLYTSLEGKIKELEKTQKALLESRTWLDQIINAVPDPIFVKDSRHKWILLNNSFCHLMGLTKDDIIGKMDYDLFKKSEAEVFWAKDEEVLHSGRENINEETLTDTTGEIHTLVTKKDRYTDKGGNHYIVGIIRDITEQVKLEGQLQQKAKLEAVGRLAGGVAHDFNNMLGAILGYGEMALEQTSPGDPVNSALTEIMEAATRSADITRQLLAFARKQTVAPKVIDINDIIIGMLNMIRRLIGENIELHWTPGNNLWKVKMDPSQIDQILVNLCVNAKDAMQTGGTISIETGTESFDEEFCRNELGFLPGDFVYISVSDTGCGMDEQTREHIFEPFFTTKGLNKGTGLGLATVYGIVKQNSGFIKVYSTPGEGTEFKIFLSRENEREKRDDQKKGEETLLRGKETILLVEDEPVILKLARTILEQLGYTVFYAGSAAKALELAEKKKQEIDLLLTDVVMPDMNGSELSEKLREIIPGLRCLFMSGYPANVVTQQGILDSAVNYLQKPFSKTEMSIKVRRVLDAPRS